MNSFCWGRRTEARPRFRSFLDSGKEEMKIFEENNTFSAKVHSDEFHAFEAVKRKDRKDWHNSSIPPPTPKKISSFFPPSRHGTGQACLSVQEGQRYHYRNRSVSSESSFADIGKSSIRKSHQKRGKTIFWPALLPPLPRHCSPGLVGLGLGLGRPSSIASGGGRARGSSLA